MPISTASSDPANALGVTQQIDKEPALASEAERIKALRQSIYKQLPREEVPPRCVPESSRRSAV